MSAARRQARSMAPSEAVAPRRHRRTIAARARPRNCRPAAFLPDATVARSARRVRSCASKIRRGGPAARACAVRCGRRNGGLPWPKDRFGRLRSLRRERNVRVAETGSGRLVLVGSCAPCAGHGLARRRYRQEPAGRRRPRICVRRFRGAVAGHCGDLRGPGAGSRAGRTKRGSALRRRVQRCRGRSPVRIRVRLRSVRRRCERPPAGVRRIPSARFANRMYRRPGRLRGQGAWAPSRRRRRLPGCAGVSPARLQRAEVCHDGHAAARLSANAAPRANARAGTPAHPRSQSLRRDGVQCRQAKLRPKYRRYAN